MCSNSLKINMTTEDDEKNQKPSSNCSSASISPVVDVLKNNSEHDQTPPSSFNPIQSQTSENFFPTINPAINPIDRYRLQFCNYAMIERLRNPNASNLQLYQPFGANCGSRLAFSLFQNRMFHNEEPKPQHSYIGLIAMAILGVPDQKLVLSDIYQHILDNYPYFRSRGPGWRNSIRHNLSLNDCFIKAGRSANGKGHYWAIHPANIEDFKKGDFRRRKAQRKVRKHMGLEVDEDADSPSPPPLSITPPHMLFPPQPFMFNFNATAESSMRNLPPIYTHSTTSSSRKRQFDVASLLAPDNEYNNNKRINLSEPQEDEDIDVVASDDFIKKTELSMNLHRPMNYPIPFGHIDPRLLSYYQAIGPYQSANSRRNNEQSFEKDN